MPFLKFSRDRHGYESTFLVRTAGRRQGGDRPQLLYWFRTPPHVKVGRAAFDEDAIRLLEAQHPEVDFDWDTILEAKAPPPPEPRDMRPPMRRERRPARQLEPPPQHRERTAPSAHREPPREPVRSEGPEPNAEAVRSQRPVTATSQEGVPPGVASTPPLAIAPPEGDQPPRRFVRVFDAGEGQGPAADEETPQVHHATDPSVVERLLGPERLTMLRARYAEVLARISARGGDPARLDALRTEAERVNPDAWVTEADVRAALEQLEPALAQLHRLAGRRRRRRPRRTRPGENPARAAGILTTGSLDESEAAPAADNDTDEADRGED